MSKPQLFGTDGIRGAFGSFPLDEATVRRLGEALAMELLSRHQRSGGGTLGGGTPHVVLGGDTRDSTPELCRWLAGSLAGHGVTFTYLGTVPTPTVAVVASALKAACGIAVSASHNPHPDNGIKLIDSDGFKWSAAAEAELEERLAGIGAVDPRPEVALEVDAEAFETYRRSLVVTLSGERPLAGLTVALDAGNGAAAPYAGALFEQLGARVRVTGVGPDGRNINAGCGSTHPEVVAELTRASAADVGFAFDGDADRVVIADEQGGVRDGDAILYLWARELQRQGGLPGDRIVATSMSNLGLEVALRRSGIGLVRCGVGDRKVVAAMQREGIVLGGEQSGHIVHLGLASQGDGLLTALQLARLLLAAGRPLSEILAGFERFPQLLTNVKVGSKPELESLPRVVAARDSVLAQLGDSGRLVLRYSGTESLARIMIEGPDRDQIQALTDELAEAIAAELS